MRLEAFAASLFIGDGINCEGSVSMMENTYKPIYYCSHRHLSKHLTKRKSALV